MERHSQSYTQPDYFAQRNPAPPLSALTRQPLPPPPPDRFSHQPHHTWSPSNALATHQSPSVPFPSLASSLALNAQRMGQYSLPAPSAQPRVAVSVVSFLEALELNEYITIFLNEGFDRMESLVDAQEDDFAAMGVKRGHRRIIQRELATMRGVPLTAPLNISGRDSAQGDDDDDDEDSHHGRESSVTQTNHNTIYLGPASGSQASRSVGASASEPSTKRRYRRHPKPDSSAPEKPPSAYVEFSNAVREELKGAGKNFTEIARHVGELWQKVDREEKEQREANAAEAKMQYTSLMTEYKKTPQYAAYQAYLADFRIKHPADASTPASHPSPRAGETRRAGPGTPAPTPPTLYSRSSGEDSNADVGPSFGGSDGSHHSRRTSSLGPSDGAEGVSLAAYRKRQRVESSGEPGDGSSLAGAYTLEHSPLENGWPPSADLRDGGGGYDAPVPLGVSRRTSGGRTIPTVGQEQLERDRSLIRLSGASASNHVVVATSDLRSSARPSLPQHYDTSNHPG